MMDRIRENFVDAQYPEIRLLPLKIVLKLILEAYSFFRKKQIADAIKTVLLTSLFLKTLLRKSTNTIPSNLA